MGGINGADLDRWITGNYGANIADACEDDGCDQYESCPYDLDHDSCNAEAAADAECDRRRDHG